MKANKLRKIICSEGNPRDSRCASFKWCNKVKQETIEEIEKCKTDENIHRKWNDVIDYVIKKLNLIQETMK